MRLEFYLAKIRKQSEYGNAFEEATAESSSRIWIDILTDGALNEIRPIWCEVDVYPRAHGTYYLPARNSGFDQRHAGYTARCTGN